MTEIEKLTQEIVRLRETIEGQRQGRLMRVPDAARELCISPNMLRKLIREGRIRAQAINPMAKNIHYIIDIQEAKDALK